MAWSGVFFPGHLKLPLYLPDLGLMLLCLQDGVLHGGVAWWMIRMDGVYPMGFCLVVISNSFVCSPRTLGKMNPISRKYFSNGLVQPPTSFISWWDQRSLSRIIFNFFCDNSMTTTKNLLNIRGGFLHNHIGVVVYSYNQG